MCVCARLFLCLSPSRYLSLSSRIPGTMRLCVQTPPTSPPLWSSALLRSWLHRGTVQARRNDIRHLGPSSQRRARCQLHAPQPRAMEMDCRAERSWAARPRNGGLCPPPWHVPRRAAPSPPTTIPVTHGDFLQRHGSCFAVPSERAASCAAHFPAHPLNPGGLEFPSQPVLQFQSVIVQSNLP